MRDPAHGCGRDCGPHTVVRPTLHIGTEQQPEHFTDVCETTATPSRFVIPRGDLGDLEGPAVLARTPFDAAATFVQFALSAYPNVIQIICSLIAVSFHTTLANRLPRTRLRFEDPVEPFLLESIDS